MHARSRPTPRRAPAPRAVAASPRLACARGRGRSCIAGLVVRCLAPLFHQAVQEIALPLRHEDIIRQQAADKGLDPALVAAVIYAESHFRDRTSSAGAQGLMQITPETAQVHRAASSGGTAFALERPRRRRRSTSPTARYYLRYLLDRYGGNERARAGRLQRGRGQRRPLAGRRARGREGHALRSTTIPFAETRAVRRASPSRPVPTVPRVQRGRAWATEDAAAAPRRAECRLGTYGVPEATLAAGGEVRPATGIATICGRQSRPPSAGARRSRRQPRGRRSCGTSAGALGGGRLEARAVGLDRDAP